MKQDLRTPFTRTILILLIWLALASAAFAQTWTQKTNYPLTTGIDAVTSFNIGNKIYTAGGAGSKYFFEYDPAANTWTQKAEVPGITGYRAFGVAFAAGGKGYIALGADGGVMLKDIWEYDPAANTWTRKADFPGAARTTAGCFVINNKAYVVAGVDSADFYTNQVWEYDPAGDIWSGKHALPVAAAFPFTFAIGGKGYAMGGDVGSSIETSATYEYDPVTNNWTPKASFTGAPRQAGVSFVMNNIAYCGLGMSNYVNMYGDMFQFDPVANTWSAAGSFDGGERAWSTAAVANNKAYIGTGWDFNTFFKDWWEFAVVTSLEQPGKTPIIMYPNPATNSVHIKRAGTAPVAYEIYNVAGQQMLTGMLPADGLIQTASLAQGQYIVELRQEGQVQRAMLAIAAQ